MVITSMGDAEAIQQLRSAVAEGKHWYIALLEAARLWASTEEDYNGRHYQYLIDNEAFNWLVLAERLCLELDGLIPEKERSDLLFFDRAPIELTKDEFKNLIGSSKYQAYLNYLYGVLVEQFLILAITEEIRKRKRVLGLNNDNGVVDEAYQQIYGITQVELLKRFRREKCHPHSKSINLSELDEFTYWLFKYRVKTHDKSRAASDTKKALVKLHGLSKRKTELAGALSSRHSADSK
jgi:hypothetical protein